MRLLVVHTRRMTTGLDAAAVRERLERLVADGTLKGRRPVVKGFVWWASISESGFRARYERLRFFLDVSGRCSSGPHPHSTEVEIMVTVDAPSAFALGLLCAGMCALFAAFPYWPFGLIALASIAFEIGVFRSASRHARDFVDHSLVPALAGSADRGLRPTASLAGRR